MSTQKSLQENMQRRSGRSAFYTRMERAASGFVRLILRRPRHRQQSNIYRHCNELPLDIFIDCLCDSKLDRLIISGSCGLRELGEAWDRIFWEYCELSNSPTFKNIFQSAKDLGYIETKLTTLRLAYFVLSRRYSQSVVESLRRVNCHCEFPINDTVKYMADLKKVENHIRAATIDQSIRIAEQEQIKAREKKSVATDDKFAEVLIVMSRFMGYKVNPREITVTEFIAIKKTMEASRPKPTIKNQ